MQVGSAGDGCHLSVPYCVGKGHSRLLLLPHRLSPVPPALWPPQRHPGPERACQQTGLKGFLGPRPFL